MRNPIAFSLYRLMAIGLILALASGAVAGAAFAGGDPGFSKEFAVGQQVENDDFSLTVDRVSMSDAETLVHITLVDKLGGAPMDYIGEAILRSGDLVLEGELVRGVGVEVTPSSSAQEMIVKFPALPKDTTGFTLTLPTAVIQTDGTASISLQLPESIDAAAKTVELDQEVTIQGNNYRFTRVQVSPSGVEENKYNVSIRYEPLGVGAASNPLTGPLTQIVLSDNLGNTYPLRLIDSSWNPDTGTILWERLSFRSAPSDKVTTLTLEIDGLGRTASLPVPATITVVE